MLKDGHLFSVHVLDPKVQGEGDEAASLLMDEVLEKADTEKSEKDGRSIYSPFYRLQRSLVDYSE